MQNKPIRPGYVPVTIELPAALAEEFQRKNYDWSPVVRLLLHEFTPGDIAKTLLILYFEFTQQLAIAPADLSLSGSELRKHLCTIQNLYQAMRSLENSGQIATPIEES